jgi:hypothetical protein
LEPPPKKWTSLWRGWGRPLRSIEGSMESEARAGLKGDRAAVAIESSMDAKQKQ